MKKDYIKSRIIDRFSDGGRYFDGTYDDEALAYIENTRQHFPLREAVDHTYFKPKTSQRYLLVKERWGHYVEEDIIDVGSRDKTVERIFSKRCTLLDKNNPQLHYFDWEKEQLPFEERSFETVICLDTLEHINDIHLSFTDLSRITKNHLIISLPNCWRKTWKKFLRGYGSGASYGLPPEKPKDRHKWFFNTEDVDNFLFYSAYKNKLKVIDVVYLAPKTRLWHKIVYPIVKKIAPTRFKNFFVETIFVLLERRN